MADYTKTDPFAEKWLALYAAAEEYEKTKPWQWMSDSDMFGVIDPDTAEVGYCCVLGEAGECFGLAVYLGDQGYETFVKVIKGEYEGRFEETVYVNRSLLLTFDDKKGLEKPDLEWIKRLKVDWSGRTGWPCFRSYRPGYLPWYLDEHEVVFLTVCIRQAVEFALRFKKNPTILNAPDRKSRLVMEQDEEGRWKDRWYLPEPVKKVVPLLFIPDAKRIKDILDTVGQNGMTWEIDVSYSPMPIMGEGDRPYFPLTFYAVDRESFFVLNAHIFSPDTLYHEIPEQFLKAIENNKMYPAEILVRREDVYAGLKLIADQLGITIRKKRNLKAVDDVKRHMAAHFKGLSARKRC